MGEAESLGFPPSHMLWCLVSLQQGCLSPLPACFHVFSQSSDCVAVTWLVPESLSEGTTLYVWRIHD